MKVGFVGLGKMGMGMVIRLVQKKHSVVVYNRTPEKMNQAVQKGAKSSESLADLVAQLQAPRVVWMMLPEGRATEKYFIELISHLQPGDLLIDSSNSDYKDTLRRHVYAKNTRIHFMDIGVSGGVFAEQNGYYLMAGGETEMFRKMLPLLKSLAPQKGFALVGSCGAGHYAKMVYSDIKAGAMRAYADGFALLKSDRSFDLNVSQLSELWSHESLIRSWLLELHKEVPASFRLRQKQSFIAKVAHLFHQKFGRI